MDEVHQGEPKKANDSLRQNIAVRQSMEYSSKKGKEYD